MNLYDTNSEVLIQMDLQDYCRPVYNILKNKTQKFFLFISHLSSLRKPCSKSSKNAI